MIDLYIRNSLIIYLVRQLINFIDKLYYGPDLYITTRHLLYSY